MRAGYFLGRALSGMRAAPFVHGVAALTVAVALTLSGAAAAVAAGAGELLSAWGLRAEITLYLDPAVPEGEGARIASEAAELAGGEASFVPPALALARLQKALGPDGDVLRGLPSNPLPPSIDVIPRGAPSAAEVTALAGRMQSLPGVVEVDFGRAWIDRVSALSRAVRILGLTVLPLVLLGAGVLAGSVVRLAVYARRDEIEILRLVGATDAFVRAPFLIEGFLSGLLGGSVAAGALFLLAQRVAPALAAALPGMTSPFLLASPGHLSMLALGGGLLGLLASALSVGRHLRSV